MKIKTICTSLLLGSVLNVSVYAADGASYLQLKSVEVEMEMEMEDKKQTLKLEVKTKGQIPLDC